ncbi:family 10 glycosylhydrolase [Calothrix sp. UHCC 0171]|uniref:family 10 glycosylhydrolase n=1 Tax=Calothrix sp. UHCC 0171 TaxID=3110245 RepID=UPI002B207A98|nr:family 10 glycosylhydrolase [Calothrix sp. UHCC 0171]MEA5573265.1 family 10 glycosylhydrolase [Calothrix sp. UHCC 0171]
MPNRPLNVAKPMFFWRHLLAVFVTSSLLLPFLANKPISAQVNEYCQLSPRSVQEKENLRISALRGNEAAQISYKQILKQHAQIIKECRQQNWLKVQAIWLRLYPCDIKAGSLDRIMDRIANKGYNQVYVETFYDGRVLLPANRNPTPWKSVVNLPGAENADLLAAAIQKGRQRGLKVYSWMYTNNFGYSYAQRKDRENAIARNGKGQTSLYVVDNGTQVFIDPYNKQAKADYYRMVEEVARRRPDGILFDYVRYPRQAGEDSIATKVTDLWLYTEATQQALFRRAKNYKGLELIRRFIGKGYITVSDINDTDRLYPQENEPLWQGRNPTMQKAIIPPGLRQPQLQSELWQLSVAHAMQGIVDFVNMAAYPAQKMGIPAGTVFFPEGNQILGQGYDSRLQPWDRFPSSLEWHPMSYANCGNAGCIAQQVERVLRISQSDTQIIPAIAGSWGKSISNRPSLEIQMQALRQFAPRVRGISHFAYSWQYPQHDSDRKFCQAQ